MVRTKGGKDRTLWKAYKANMKGFEDSYRPGDVDGDCEALGLQDDCWRPNHHDPESHTRTDSYRPDHKSIISRHNDTYRPGEWSTFSDYDSYRPGQNLKNQTQADAYCPGDSSTCSEYDTYRPGQDPNLQTQADIYRPTFVLTKQNTTPSIPIDAGMMPAPKVDFATAAFDQPSASHSSLAAAEMDVDMDILLLTAGNLTIDREESAKSIVALTRELIVRGLPLELANLYASEKVPMIPLHKIFRGKKGKPMYCHKAKCKTCGKLQPRDPAKKGKKNLKHSHICTETATEEFQAQLDVKGWRFVFKNLDTKTWKLGPGPHDEKDSLQILGKELFEAARLSGRNGTDLVTSFTRPDSPHKSKTDLSPSSKRTRGENKVARRILAQMQQKASPPSAGDIALAQARARAVVIAQTKKENRDDPSCSNDGEDHRATPYCTSTTSTACIQHQ